MASLAVQRDHKVSAISQMGRKMFLNLSERIGMK